MPIQLALADPRPLRRRGRESRELRECWIRHRVVGGFGCGACFCQMGQKVIEATTGFRNCHFIVRSPSPGDIARNLSSAWIDIALPVRKEGPVAATMLPGIYRVRYSNRASISISLGCPPPPPLLPSPSSSRLTRLRSSSHSQLCSGYSFQLTLAFAARATHQRRIS